MKKFFDENLAKGFIRANSFPAAAPILFIKKPGGGFRLCVNYKAFNAITVKNKYPLPLIQIFLNQLVKIKYFTKLNIVVVFNKIRMVEKKKNGNVTTSISDRESLPGTSAKVCAWQSGQTFHGTLGTFSSLGTLATFRTCQTFLTFTSYIYVVISQINSFFL